MQCTVRNNWLEFNLSQLIRVQTLDRADYLGATDVLMITVKIVNLVIINLKDCPKIYQIWAVLSFFFGRNEFDVE